MKLPRIIVLRHGESEEDVDKTVYRHKADLDVDLSPAGVLQVLDLRPRLLEKMKGTAVLFYLSPGVRLKRTHDLLVEGFPSHIKARFHTEPRIIKQYWGDVTVENRREIEIERYRAGVLVYRFPNGESGPELIARFGDFVRTLRQSFVEDECPDTVIIITHGFEMRVFLMALLGFDESTFEGLANPRNCEMAVLSGQSDGTYRLEEPLRIYEPHSNLLHVERKKNE